MHLGIWAGRFGVVVMGVAMAATSCSATETVTINEAAVASATSTAIRDNASTDQPQDPADATTDESAPTNTPGQTDDSDDSTTTTETETEAPPPTSSSAEDTGCVFTFVDDFGDIQIELSFTNELPVQDDALASYELYDGNGALLVESAELFEELLPGERVRVAVDTLTDVPVDRGARAGISCALVGIESSPFGFDKYDPTPTDSCTFIEIDSFGDIQIQVSVVSPLDTSSELAVDYALRGPDGVRFGDSVAFLDEVGPGQSSTTSVDTFTELPNWVTESSFSCEILSIEGF